MIVLMFSPWVGCLATASPRLFVGVDPTSLDHLELIVVVEPNCANWLEAQYEAGSLDVEHLFGICNSRLVVLISELLRR